MESSPTAVVVGWVINISIDPDKTSVGSATAVYTDADGSTFSASGRATMTGANANAFANQSVAARNAWQGRKNTEATARNTMVNSFTTAGESATPQTAGNNGTVVINL